MTTENIAVSLHHYSFEQSIGEKKVSLMCFTVTKIANKTAPSRCDNLNQLFLFPMISGFQVIFGYFTRQNILLSSLFGALPVKTDVYETGGSKTGSFPKC